MTLMELLPKLKIGMCITISNDEYKKDWKYIYIDFGDFVDENLDYVYLSPTDLESNDWCIYKLFFEFDEALDYLNSGCKIAREEWMTGEYLVKQSETFVFYRGDEVICDNYAFNYNDMHSRWWVIDPFK